jgi:rRNA maturation endonuclease Nob1
MLVGLITDNLVMDLEEAVAKVYMRTCWKCEKEFKYKKSALCEVCRNKE